MKHGKAAALRALIALVSGLRTRGARAVTPEQLRRAAEEHRPLAHVYTEAVDLAALEKRGRQRRRAAQTHPRKRR